LLILDSGWSTSGQWKSQGKVPRCSLHSAFPSAPETVSHRKTMTPYIVSAPLHKSYQRQEMTFRNHSIPSVRQVHFSVCPDQYFSDYVHLLRVYGYTVCCPSFFPSYYPSISCRCFLISIILLCSSAAVSKSRSAAAFFICLFKSLTSFSGSSLLMDSGSFSSIFSCFATFLEMLISSRTAF